MCPDLTYAVCFNLANQYDANGMYTEALNTYSLIVKDKNYPNAGRLRVNMGNIYFKMADVMSKGGSTSGQQGKYTNAIKMYRMALDQIPTTAKEIRFRILVSAPLPEAPHHDAEWCRGTLALPSSDSGSFRMPSRTLSKLWRAEWQTFSLASTLYCATMRTCTPTR